MGSGGAGGYAGAGGEGGGTGGTGGSDGRGTCRADGSDCGLAVSVPAFDEGTCPGGSSRTVLRLDNLTDAPLTGTVQVTGGATVEVVPDRFTLPSHGDTSLAVIFAPPADAPEGRDGAVLHVVLDGGGNRYIVVDVLATVDSAAPPSLGVLCGEDLPCELLDLGSVPVGESAVVPVLVVNDGCDDLSLLLPELGAGGHLALVDPPAFPAPLPPRGTLALEVEFTPAAAGPTSGNLALATEEGTSRVVPWVGRGE